VNVRPPWAGVDSNLSIWVVKWLRVEE